jgi:TPR repeat protein
VIISQIHRSIASSLIRASSLCLGLIIASVSSLSADQAATLAEAIAQTYNPTQISALVAAAAGRVETGTDVDPPSSASLQHTLQISNDVAVALLRIVDRTGITPDRLANELAKSAIEYHAVLDRLADMNVPDSAESQMVQRARAAMTAGRFSEAEAEIRQVEDREVAALGRSTDASAVLNEHRFVAAHARTLLGTIALMKLEYNEAAEDFLLARQRLSQAPSDQPDVIRPQPVAAPSLADPVVPVQDHADVARPIDGQEATEERPPDGAAPTTPHSEATVAPGQVTMALTQPTAMTLAAPDQPKPVPAPITEAAAKSPPAVATLSTSTLQLLLRRGDAMLALGDVASARLLYTRAASAGDARGAFGVAKTYDPNTLSQIGARGIQADPAVAADWYGKALDLGDASAAAPLRLLGQAR